MDKCDTATECLLDFIKRLTWQENVEISEAGSDSYFVQFINVPTGLENFNFFNHALTFDQFVILIRCRGSYATVKARNI